MTSPRDPRSTERGRLVRLGFADPTAAAEALAVAGVAADEKVVEAVADTPDPDLAASALGRLVVGVRHPLRLQGGGVARRDRGRC